MSVRVSLKKTDDPNSLFMDKYVNNQEQFCENVKN